MQLPFERIAYCDVVRRSVDARQRQIRVLLTVNVYLVGEAHEPHYLPPVFCDVSGADRQVVVVGAGPAGLFCALRLLEYGIRPVVIDRGREVSIRKRDIALLNRNEGLQPESNYCFGEGGAGTFSDGKLFSRSKKRGDMQRVMELFHYFGAADTVLYEAHAHIGSDKLPTIIQRMRQTIVDHGGVVRYGTRMERLLLDGTAARGVVVEGGETIPAEAVVLAIGHSAHDTYLMLHEAGIRLEAKGFAMGVRVEHPQALIDRLFYKPLATAPDPKELLAQIGHAAYSLVTQVDGRGVYSFCMCPGGHIVPASSSADSCVVNGMSASHRNSPFANSGIVVEIRPDDIPEPFAAAGPLAGLRFQQYVEHLAFEHGESPSKAPAQRLTDFVEGRASVTLPRCSYLPGVVPSRLDLWLPPMIGRRLRQGFRDFDRRYRGFLSPEAVVLGVESRSSSPVRIPRDKDNMQHVDISRLYPCGEGAGYAGGITSSALDGINAAEQIHSLLC